MHGRFSIIGGHVPGLPPKSRPMQIAQIAFLHALIGRPLIRQDTPSPPSDSYCSSLSPRGNIFKRRDSEFVVQFTGKLPDVESETNLIANFHSQKQSQQEIVFMHKS